MIDVSVVMSVYNAEPYLKNAINSILGQTYQDFEFVIVDDGSTDRSAEIVKSFSDARIVFLQQSNRGLANSLNRGIRESHGKYIARMDADDESMPERLGVQRNFSETHPEYIIVGSSAVIMDQEGRELHKVRMPSEHEAIINRLPFKPIFYHSSVMFSKSAFLSCGGYNERIHHFFEDQVLWNQMAKSGKFHNLPQPLIKYRLSPTSISYNKPRDKTHIHKIISTIISGKDLLPDDQNFIEKLKRKQPITKLYSDYCFSLGNIYRTILKDDTMARKYYFSALRQNLLNIKALLRLSQALFLVTRRGPDNEPNLWIELE